MSSEQFAIPYTIPGQSKIYAISLTATEWFIAICTLGCAFNVRYLTRICEGTDTTSYGHDKESKISSAQVL